MWVSGALFGVILGAGTVLLFKGEGTSGALVAATVMAFAFLVPFIVRGRGIGRDDE